MTSRHRGLLRKDCFRRDAYATLNTATTLAAGICARQAPEHCGLAARAPQNARVPQSERTKRNSPCPSCASWLISPPNRMQEERKTPEMRAQMTDIERLRHSTAHVLVSCHVERSRDISRYYV